MRVVKSPFGMTVTVPCVCTVRPKGGPDDTAQIDADRCTSRTWDTSWIRRGGDLLRGTALKQCDTADRLPPRSSVQLLEKATAP